MLQLTVSQSINTNAVYPTVAATNGITQVLLDFTQSYDFSKTINVIANLANVPSATNPWLVIQLSGSVLPTASGQYNVDIFEFTQSATTLTWSTQNTIWNQTNVTWGGTGAYTKTKYLSTERAFISGSNEYTIVQYLLPSNGGTYTTYNHP
jgi:hypothetical protein